MITIVTKIIKATVLSGIDINRIKTGENNGACHIV